MRWAIYDSVFRMQVAIDGIVANFPNRFVAGVLRLLVFPKGLTLAQPSDQLGHEVARLMLEPSAARDRLTGDMYLPRDENDPIGKLELALEATIAAEPIEAKLREAGKAGKLGKFMTVAELWESAAATGVITDVELAQLQRTQRLKRSVIDVDDFEFDFGLQSKRLVAEQKAKEMQAWPRAASM